MIRQLTFDDLGCAILNPSVDDIDERRLLDHVRRLFGLFKARWVMNLPVSTLDLMEFGKAQYNARLSELRRALIEQGWCIDRISQKPVGGVHYYKLVPLEESEFYKQRKDRL